MAPSPNLSPIRSDAFTYERARHLLNRAGFGGTPRQIVTLQTMGLDAAVEHLVDYQALSTASLPEPTLDPDLIRPPTADERAAYARARRDNDQATLDRLRAMQLARQGQDMAQFARLQRWWLARMIATPRPLEEKLILLWHGHFATNYRTIDDAYLMYQQYRLFQRHAAGNFGDLVGGIIRDPAMIRFLDNHRNRRAAPNENLARELMELFTLGEGQYSEEDIRQGARALTGYTYHDNDFVFDRRNHDPGTKTILGQRGTHDGEAFVSILLQQPACAQFVCFKLYKHFVADVDKPADVGPEARTFIQRLAQELVRHRYALKPVLKTLFKSRHFYDEAIVANQIKSPAQLVAGTVRMLYTPVRDIALLNDAMGMMGQRLFDPPSVAGWDGGRLWINTSTLFVRQNLCAYLISGRKPFADSRTDDEAAYDPRFLIEQLPDPTPEAVVDHLLATLLSSQAARLRREPLIRFLHERHGVITRDTLIAVLLLITAMPEYQLC